MSKKIKTLTEFFFFKTKPWGIEIPLKRPVFVAQHHPISLKNRDESKL